MTESMGAMICANAGKCASQRSIHKQHQNSRKDETSNVFKTFEVFYRKSQIASINVNA